MAGTDSCMSQTDSMPGDDRYRFTLRDSYSIPGSGDCRVTRVAHEHWARGMRIERDRVRSVVLLLVLRGGARYRSGPHEDLLEPGDLVVFAASHACTLSVERAPGLECLIVACAGSQAAARVDAELGPLEHPRRLANPAEAATIMEAMLRQLADRRPGGRELCQRYLPVLLGILRQGLERAATAAPGRATWLAAREWIAHHASEATVSAVAHACGVSPEHLNRLYRRYGGIRTREAIARARCTAAAERLLTSDAPLGAIAAEHGYADAYSFSRAFRRVMGVPPSRWRREAV